MAHPSHLAPAAQHMRHTRQAAKPSVAVRHASEQGGQNGDDPAATWKLQAHTCRHCLLCSQQQHEGTHSVCVAVPAELL
jgi:hypothetical protein